MTSLLSKSGATPSPTGSPTPWMRSVFEALGEVVAIDGKRLGIVEGR